MADALLSFSVFDITETAEFLGARRYWFGLNDLGGEGDWRWIDTGDRLTYMTKWHTSADGTINTDHIVKYPHLSHSVRALNSAGLVQRKIFSKSCPIFPIQSAELKFITGNPNDYFKS